MKLIVAVVLISLALLCFALATCAFFGCSGLQVVGGTTPAPTPSLVDASTPTSPVDASAGVTAVCEHLCAKGCTEWCMDGIGACELGLQNLLDTQSVRVDLDCLATTMGCDTRSCVQ